MNTFKRKALASAVLGTLGVAGSAHAIYQDPTGTGQALIYPYFTVNSVSGNAFNTLISVTNTTTAVKVVKVRFREGKASQEVLDFNLYLSPNDMWTGGIIAADATSSSPGHLVTSDVSCTNPPIPAGGVDFRNYAFAGSNADALNIQTLDRTREGYLEMFEMGVLTPGAFATAAIHGASGSPTCTGLTGTNLLAAITPCMTAPTGGLMGTGTLINVNSGRDTMYNALSFGQYSATVVYRDIGNESPNFNDTNPASSVVLVVAGASANPSEIYVSTWTPDPGTLATSAGAKAASATMMHTDILNEYILDATSASDTDWVVTMPTKRLFVSAASAVAPFTNVLTTSGACERIGVTFFNREEKSVSPSSVDFSPTPPGAPSNTLCYESTVISFRNGSTNAPAPGAGATSLVLGSANVTNVNITTGFQNGWSDLTFTGTNAVAPVGLGSAGVAGTLTLNIVTAATSTAAQTFFGLPVVGFMIRTFSNGNLSCGSATCQGNYGGSAMHAYKTLVTPTP